MDHPLFHATKLVFISIVIGILFGYTVSEMAIRLHEERITRQVQRERDPFRACFEVRMVP